MGEAKMSLKLLVDSKRQKVVFAEAGKEFVDFLFHILSLPVATVVKLLDNSMMGSLGDLYKSLRALSSDYLQENLDEHPVLKPLTSNNSDTLLSLDNNFLTGKKVFKCDNNHTFYTDIQGTRCPSCAGPYYNTMSREMSYVGSNNSSGGITSSSNNGSCGNVKGVGITYMVMDNLEVKPMSTISSITTLNKLNIKDISSLVEKEVRVGLKEGVALLKASLETQTVLTTAFLGRKRRI